MSRRLGQKWSVLSLIAALAALLSVGSLRAASAGSPGQHPVSSAKEAVLSHQFSRPSNAVMPAAKIPGYRPAPDFPKPPVNLGTIRTADLQPPVSHTLFTPSTEWMDRRGQIQIQVYGGASASDPAEGAIFVWAVDLTTDLAAPGTGTYLAPAKTGPLVLTRVSGDVVSFSYGGGIGTFDLGSHKFTIG